MLEFDPTTHTYRWNGTVVPSNTQILKERGFIDDKWFTEESRARGQAVHAATHYLDEGDLDWETVDPVALPYVRAYQKFCDDVGFVSELVEVPLYNPTYQYATTLDRTGWITKPKDKKVLIDFKTGQVSPWVGLQLAGQNLCLKTRLPRYALQLNKDETYRLIPFTDRAEHDLFVSQVVTYHWIQNNKGGSHGSTSAA
jgi:hypothetical protein